MPRYSVDAFIRQHGHCAGHLLTIEGEVTSIDVDVRRVQLVSHGRKRELTYSELPSRVRWALDEALESAYLDDMNDREQAAADIEIDRGREEC